MRVLMLSRDASGLDPLSGTSLRWKMLRDAGIELDIVIATSNKSSWNERGILVQGTGGANPIVRFWRMSRLAQAAVIRCDMVTSQDPFELGWIAWCTAKRAAKRFEIQDHGGFFDGAPADEPLWFIRSRLARFLARRAHRIRTVSPGSLREFKKTWIGEKAYVLPIAARESFASVPRNPAPGHIVTVGRLVSVKRVDLLLRAFCEVKSERPDAALTIVGDGPLKGELIELTKQLGIGSSVQFVGEGEPAPYLERASAFALVSLHEGWGIAAVEAAMAGVPVVMTDTGCAPVLAEQGCATIVKDVTPKGIATALLEALVQKTETRFSGAVSMTSAIAQQVVEWKALLEEKPRTLICAQAVDPQDPLFGFFVPWLQEFSKQGKVIACALRVSDPMPDLGADIEIVPLRRIGSRSKLGVLSALFATSWKNRFRYDAVFVRGDAQYVALMGWFWRLLGKRIVFWYAHYSARSVWFWLAVPWVHDVVTSVPEANPLSSAVCIGQHIDTDRLLPEARQTESVPRVLLFGRVSPVKRVAWTVKAISPFFHESRISLRVVGTATTAAAREDLLSVLPSREMWEDRDVLASDVASLYNDADIYINATPGSMDKTILEAASCGRIVLSATAGILHGLPEDLHWLRFSDETALKASLERALSLTYAERAEIGARLREWVKQHHSLQSNCLKLSALLFEKSPKAPLRQFVRQLLWRVSVPSTPPGVPVLMFHSMDGKGSAGWDRRRFLSLLVRLLSRGYSATHFPPSHAQSVVLTFDDATEDFLDIVPVLEQFRLPAIVFAPADTKEIRASDGVTRQVLQKKDLARIAQSGLIRVGGHGRTHESLPGLSDTELRAQIQDSAAFVLSIQREDLVQTFAYPRGKYGAREMSVVRDAGFEYAFTVQPGYWTERTDALQVPRLPVLRWMTSTDVERLAYGAWDM